MNLQSIRDINTSTSFPSSYIHRYDRVPVRKSFTSKDHISSLLKQPEKQTVREEESEFDREV